MLCLHVSVLFPSSTTLFDSSSVHCVGGGGTYTLNQFIECIENHVGKKAIIKKMPNQMGDVQLTSANLDFSNKFLGFEPKWTLDKGIEETVKWYCQYKKVCLQNYFSKDDYYQFCILSIYMNVYPFYYPWQCKFLIPMGK